MRFAMLGSGSRGNATLVQSGETTVLVDCGFMLRECERRLELFGVKPWDLSAIVVTHEHFDHIGGVARLARKHKLPVFMTKGTHEGWKHAPVPRTTIFDPADPFTVGALQIEPVPVPHDAREPCHYVLGNGSFRVGVLSDAGAATDGMREALSGCDALLLEFNHDVEMLINGPYKPPLKQRIASAVGHLSNVQSAALLASLDNSRLKHLVLTHLSEKNNTPELALAAARGALKEKGSQSFSNPELVCANQDGGLAWRTLQ